MAGAADEEMSGWLGRRAKLRGISARLFNARSQGYVRTLHVNSVSDLELLSEAHHGARQPQQIPIESIFRSNLPPELARLRESLAGTTPSGLRFPTDRIGE